MKKSAIASAMAFSFSFIKATTSFSSSFDDGFCVFFSESFAFSFLAWVVSFRSSSEGAEDAVSVETGSSAVASF
ncbi:hypothetical protein CU635_18015 [Bacillus canaveralius]|uniref:Secreted protein n=1 Tax=Bacillus canaveralius TaxID=1403243 RepID=A0A2N5GI08_9BACI|nr:hypothetical protein CU635_18015 [Bacillus canaveralius]